MSNATIQELCEKFSVNSELQGRAIFNMLFIVANKLQTVFDNNIPDISLKQFLLLSTIRQSKNQLTFTQVGELLGCSRQNVKKLAAILETKGFVTIEQSPTDVRACYISPTKKADTFFKKEFSKSQEELKFLFEVYSEKEIAQLFKLMTQLFSGIENLENKTIKNKQNRGEK